MVLSTGTISASFRGKRFSSPSNRKVIPSVTSKLSVLVTPVTEVLVWVLVGVTTWLTVEVVLSASVVVSRTV